MGTNRLFNDSRSSTLRFRRAGDEARTRNLQLGNLNFRSFIFTTYKTAQEKSTCMQRIQCMQCLICVSLGDLWGTVRQLILRLSKLSECWVKANFNEVNYSTGDQLKVPLCYCGATPVRCCLFVLIPELPVFERLNQQEAEDLMHDALRNFTLHQTVIESVRTSTTTCIRCCVNHREPMRSRCGANSMKLFSAAERMIAHGEH